MHGGLVRVDSLHERCRSRVGAALAAPPRARWALLQGDLSGLQHAFVDRRGGVVVRWRGSTWLTSSPTAASPRLPRCPPTCCRRGAAHTPRHPLSPLFPTTALPPHPAAPPIQPRLFPCGGAATLLAGGLDRGQVLSPLRSLMCWLLISNRLYRVHPCGTHAMCWLFIARAWTCPSVQHPCNGQAHERPSRGQPFPAQATGHSEERAAHAYRLQASSGLLFSFDFLTGHD